MLVLIDKKGVVQAVHVGYNPAIETTLTKELDDILAGKDLAREALRATRRRPSSPPIPKVWSEPGPCSGPYNGRGHRPKGQAIFALQRAGPLRRPRSRRKDDANSPLAGNDHP